MLKKDFRQVKHSEFAGVRSFRQWIGTCVFSVKRHRPNILSSHRNLEDEGKVKLTGQVINRVQQVLQSSKNKEKVSLNAVPEQFDDGSGNEETLPHLSVFSCRRLTTRLCHLFRSSAALFSW